eukprot:5383639-Lingulodinium_polyedra.AAC.1
MGTVRPFDDTQELARMSRFGEASPPWARRLSSSRWPTASWMPGAGVWQWPACGVSTGRSTTRGPTLRSRRSRGRHGCLSFTAAWCSPSATT